MELLQPHVPLLFSLCASQLPSHPVTPSSKHADSKPVPLAPAYHTLPHPSHHGTPHTTINWGPLEPPKTPKPWSLSCLRPAPPLRPSAALCYKEDLSKSPKTMKKLLPKRKPERKPSDEEFALRKSESPRCAEGCPLQTSHTEALRTGGARRGAHCLVVQLRQA